MKYFSQMSHKLVYSTTTCFTVSGSLQDSQVGGSSLDTKLGDNDQFGVS